MRLAARAVALLAAAAIPVAAAALLLRGDPPSGHARAEASRPEEAARSAAARAARRSSGTAAVARTSEPAAPPLRAAAASAAAPEQDVERSLAALANRLADPEWRRVLWDGELRSTAGSLGAEALPALLRVAADPTRSDAARVAAAEMARVLGAEPAELAAAGLARLLRPLALEESDLTGLSQAATRLVAWLDDAGDRDRLVDGLLEEHSGGRGDMLVWALVAAPAGHLAPALCRRLRRELSEPEVGHALLALDALLREDGSGPWDAATTDELEGVLSARLGRPAEDEANAQRALSACSALARRTSCQRGLAPLRRCVEDLHVSAELRLRAAEALVLLHGERAAADRRAALDHLMAVARDAPDARARERAWSILSLSVDAIGDELAPIASAERDPGVRRTADGVVAARAPK